MTRTIRTVNRPYEEVTVSDTEYEYLLDAGLVYDGTPPEETADPLDARLAERLQNPASSARTVIDGLVADSVSGAQDPFVAALLDDPESATSAAARGALGSPIVVRGPGVDPTGATDSTAAIQAILNAAPVGSEVFFPPAEGCYLISRLTIPAGVGIRGAGFEARAGGPLGEVTYGPTHESRPRGSVLRSTATDGVAVVFRGTGGHRAANLCIVGPGTGTSIGVSTLHPDDAYNVGSQLSRIMVCNFAQCWDFAGTNEGLFTSLSARGCHVGIKTRVAFNQNVLLNTEIQYSDTESIVIADASTTQWIGGLLQNVTGDVALRVVSGEINVFQGWYCETATPADDLVRIEAGSMNVFRDWWISNAESHVSIVGGARTKFENWRSASVAVTADVPGMAMFHDVDGLSITGTSAADQRVFYGATDLPVRSSIVTKTAEYLASPIDQIVVTDGVNVIIRIPTPPTVPKGKMYTVRNGHATEPSFIAIAGGLNLEGVDYTEIAPGTSQTIVNEGTRWLKL